MDGLKIGDIVARKSYNSDVLFKIVDMKNQGRDLIAILKGICYRIEADAPESDLVVQHERSVREYSGKIDNSINLKINEFNRNLIRQNLKKVYFRDTSKEKKLTKFLRPGKVLHIDGDNEYLNSCLEQYKKLNIEVLGRYIPEREQQYNIYKLLQDYRPDILVLTGHDGFTKGEKGYLSLNNYRNSSYFIEAVKEARRYERNMDELVIFAGACQSMYDGIIKAGANFASSPYRVLIHALDPVLACQKIALTSISTVMKPLDIISYTITGEKGIGGIETRGKLREGFPLEPYI